MIKYTKKTIFTGFKTILQGHGSTRSRDQIPVEVRVR